MPTELLTTAKNKNFGSLIEQDFNYDYPGGLDLHPKSELHRKLVSIMLDRAGRSHDMVAQRFSKWEKIDDSLTAYMPVDTTEEAIVEADDRKPVSIVVPLTYSIHETVMTYLVGALLENPIFRYNPGGPEDALATLKMERVIDLQAKRAKMALPLLNMFSSAHKYGIGPVAVSWDVRYGMKPTPSVFGDRVFTESVLYEGNKLEPINPYMYLPDTSMGAHRVQEFEFVGFVSRENRMSSIKRENTGDGVFFNAKYMKYAKDCRSGLFSDSRAEQGYYKQMDMDIPYSNIVDIIWMYIEIIPSEWELGDSDQPEKWLFALAGDCLIIAAQPLDLIHNMYPVVCCAPNFDADNPIPIGPLEAMYGLQNTADWMFSSHITNVRKAVNDMLIVDPRKVYMKDLREPKPGKLVRLRPTAWGEGVKDAVMQIPINDITRANVADTSYISELMQRVSGATDAMQGISRKGPERMAASEARDTRSSALGRLMKMARVIGMQAMHDLGIILAMQTQQLMEEEVFVELLGRTGEDLGKEYGVDSSATVGFQDIMIPVDVVASDGTQASGEYADTWVQLFQIMATSPEIGAQFDIVRVFKHIARLTGAQNLEDFTKKTNMQVAEMPDQVVAQEAQAGNIAPVGELFR